jgi:hypothetical protein
MAGSLVLFYWHQPSIHGRGEDGGMDTERFLAAASELLAVPSTADRPGDLRRALDFVVDFVGPGFTVERFESGGKPSALVYRVSRSSSTRTSTWCRRRRRSSCRAATAAGCMRVAPRT